LRVDEQTAVAAAPSDHRPPSSTRRKPLLLYAMMRYDTLRNARLPMDVKLDRQTEKLIHEELQAGRFSDASALVSAALKHFFIAREFGEEYTREEIESKIARGIAQLDAGEGVDGEKFFEDLRRRGTNEQPPRT
jgi:antitoxin ParD1/3/4